MIVKTKDGQTLEMHLQQYLTGLYVAVYKDGYIFDQLCFDNKENFMKALKYASLEVVSE